MSLIGRAVKETVRALRRGKAHVATNLPDLAELAHRLSDGRALLEPLYREYVRRVSPPEWAVSIETACVLHALCLMVRPRTILDLGSGFSSVTFRHYSRAYATDCVVHSVDDNARWLDRTRRFLESLDLSTEGLIEWPEFRQTMSHYQLIFHDLGDMSLRAESLEYVMELRAEAGWVILDDMHKSKYAPVAEKVCAAAGLRLVSLQDLTLDRYGRFACLLTD
jgi:predicted O-methyltransferase YrrM